MFESIGQADLQSLSNKAIEKNFKKGDIIFKEGDSNIFVYIISDGQVKSAKYTADGKEAITEILGKCDVMGQVVILGKASYDYSASALTDTSALLIKRDDFLAVIKKNSELALKLIESLSSRLKETQNKLQEFVSEKVEQRIAKALLMLKGRMGDEIPFTRQEIANMVGTTIETAIRVTSRFKEAKIIDSVRGKIMILNEQKLKVMAEGMPIKFR